MPPALLCRSASVKSCTHAQQVPQKAACQWDYWVGRNLAWGELYPFLFFLECDVQGSQKIDLKKGEMLTHKNVKENKRCSGTQHKTQNEQKISYSYTRTWLHFTSFTHNYTSLCTPTKQADSLLGIFPQGACKGHYKFSDLYTSLLQGLTSQLPDL